MPCWEACVQKVLSSPFPTETEQKSGWMLQTQCESSETTGGFRSCLFDSVRLFTQEVVFCTSCVSGIAWFLGWTKAWGNLSVIRPATPSPGSKYQVAETAFCCHCHKMNPFQEPCICQLCCNSSTQSLSDLRRKHALLHYFHVSQGLAVAFSTWVLIPGFRQKE